MRHATISLSLAATLVAGCTVSYVGRGRVARAEVSAAVYVPSYVVVTAQPPEPRAAVVVRPAQPDATAVWVEGHYEWSGGAWVWVDGRWEAGHAGEKWIDPVVHVENGRHVYYPGYWCPIDQPPAPAYARPGAVVVVARAGGTPVEPTRQGGGTPVEPTRQGGGTPVEPTRQGGGTPVEPTRQAGGTPVEPTRQGGGTPVEPTRRGGGVTATPAGPTAPSRYDAPDATAQGGQGSVRVRGGSAGTASGGTVTPRPGSAGQASGGTVSGRTPSATGGTGSVRGGTVYTPDARPGTGQPATTARTDQGGSAATPRPATTVRTDQGGSAATPRPATTVRTDQGGSAATPGPATTVRTDQGGSAVTPRPGGVVTTGRDPNQAPAVDGQQIALTCAIDTPRAPRGGAVTIRGTGFRSPTVRIGGQVVRIARSTSTELVVAAPNSPGGGDVRVTDSGREATCGRIEVR